MDTPYVDVCFSALLTVDGSRSIRASWSGVSLSNFTHKFKGHLWQIEAKFHPVKWWQGGLSLAFLVVIPAWLQYYKAAGIIYECQSLSEPRCVCVCVCELYHQGLTDTGMEVKVPQWILWITGCMSRWGESKNGCHCSLAGNHLVGNLRGYISSGSMERKWS